MVVVYSLKSGSGNWRSVAYASGSDIDTHLRDPALAKMASKDHF